MKISTPETVKHTLFESIDHLLDDRSLYLSDSDKAFSRTQKISFRDTMIFPMVLASESTPVEMLDYFPEINLPSQAALCYRRNQIKVDAYKNLFYDFTSKLSQDNTFHGMRLIGCDGTRLNTPYNPKDSGSFVSCIEGRRGFNQYHLNACYDILNDVYLDAVIQNYSEMNEIQAFCKMMDNFPKNQPAIFIADRGYDSYNIIAHAINNSLHFVIRTKHAKAMNIFDDISDWDKADSFDIEDDIFIGRVRAKNTKTLRNYHFIRHNQSYDFIQPKCKKIDKFHVRLIKFKLSENNYEYLLTNLPKETFLASDIKEIYRLRWGIETSFRFLKYAVSLNSIHSIKQNFILQEIYAKLTAYNLSSAIMKCIRSRKKSDKSLHRYETDKTYLIKLCIRYLKGKLGNILHLISKRKVPVRAGRKFGRTIRRQHADTLQYR